MARYVIYGDLQGRETVALATVLHAKGVEVDLVEESASLSLALATRAGRDDGPYLRTPEGFVLADLHAILEWIERAHPEPRLLPTAPVRRTCARMLEDWLELWLPHWPRRSWASLEHIGDHLAAAGFLLGRRPVRADWLLAAWLETEVLVHPHARAHLLRAAPRLVSFGDDLLAVERERGAERAEPSRSANEVGDVIPISLLGLLEEIGRDYHAYLVGNHRAQKGHDDRVSLDLGLGARMLPAKRVCEQRRVEIALELRALDRATRRGVSQILEPLGAWHALTLPPAIEEIDPADPRSL